MCHLKYILFAAVLLCICWSCSGDLLSPTSSTSGNTGKGGSLARFAFVGNYLYVVDDINVKTYNVSKAENPELVGTIRIGWGVETIFAYGKNLFFGSQTGVHLFEIQKDGQPKYVSFYRHFQSCDPVVSDGQYAYSTIRSGVACRTTTPINELHILDISDIQNPKQVSVVPMTNPIGLTIDGNTLFVCDAGLRILDVSDKKVPREIKYLKDIDAVDVIGLDKQLIIIGKSSVTQLDYHNLSEPRVLSVLPLKLP